jgi:riboflavin kinase/FMN adenylyltransferase
MQIIRHAAALPEELKGGVVAIGNFDGVHRGHQAVIGQAGAIARDLGAPLIALTFEPHPRSVFQPDAPAFRLTSLRAKARLLESLGVDGLVVLRFDRALAGTPAEDFISQILVRDLACRHIVVGEDFAFGRGRQGNVGMLKERGPASGFEVSPAVQERAEDGSVISSNTIRELLRAGRPDAAAALLGHDWEVDGRVIHGEARGRELGFPTANVRMGSHLAPKPGVYAVRAGLEDGDGAVRWFDGAANFGTRPQFDGEDARLEVFLMDFAGDLYGRMLRVSFVAYLRPEAAFANLDALIEQMNQDVVDARACLAEAR